MEVNFKEINEEDNFLLIDSFSEFEIRKVVWGCNGSKSPAPDGYKFNFIKSCWEVIKVDIIKDIHEFHANGKLPKGLNASFLALIPKKVDLLGLGEF